MFPERQGAALSGTEILKSLPPSASKARDEAIRDLVMAGQVPDHLRSFVPVAMKDGQNEITIFALPDVLSVGSNQDFVRVSLAPTTMQQIAGALGLSLITPKMSDAIWKAFQKIAPIPEPWYAVDGGAAMAYTSNLGVHSRAIDKAIAASGFDLSKGVAGTKKDVVITSKLASHPGKVAIYGWHKLDGTPIQGLNATSHELAYQDYSHGARFVTEKILANGEPSTLTQALADPILSKVLSNDGPVTLRYPTNWTGSTKQPPGPPSGQDRPPKGGPVIKPPAPKPSSADGSGSVWVGGALLLALILWRRKR
jgi:hypothetical protein